MTRKSLLLPARALPSSRRSNIDNIFTMNTKTNIIASALALLLAGMPATASEDSKPQAGEGFGLLQDINMFTPEDGDPAFKIKAHELYGTQWAADVAYGFWGTHNALPHTRHKNNYALLHAQLNQRLIPDSPDGGTWLRVELSGSWALDHATRAAERRGYGLAAGIEGGTGGHADMLGANALFIPELALMHYAQGGRACLIAGLVNLTNYFDAVGIANDSFASFTNTGFVNSTILPLTDSNLGVLLQWELSPNSYLMTAASRTGCEMGDNPFSPNTDGYALIAEYGHILADGAVTWRLTPFYECVEHNGHDRSRTGFATSLEYTPWEPLTLYTRAGLATHQALGGAAEFSCGATLRPFASREDDFLGISYGLFKHRNSPETGEPTFHAREHVLELMYNLQLGDHLKLVPHLQYIHNPAYRADTNHATVFGIQTVFSF